MTDRETIEWQRMEIQQLRARVEQARDQRDEALDAVDKYQRTAQMRVRLEGPEYRASAYCSDGRVWAHKADQAREETIRWFAGQAYRTAIEQNTSLDDAAKAARRAALRLWDELEQHFEAERALRKAAEEKAESEPETEGGE